MKKSMNYLLAILLTLPAGSVFSQASDKEMVYAAIEDYVEGIYQVQPERIKKSVHPQLMKKGFWRRDGNTEYDKESIMTFDQLVELAANWNAKGTLPKDAPKKIEIYDVQDQTATGKLTAQWGTDYFQLAKYDGKWMIVNIMWQRHPQK